MDTGETQQHQINRLHDEATEAERVSDETIERMHTESIEAERISDERLLAQNVIIDKLTKKEVTDRNTRRLIVGLLTTLIALMVLVIMGVALVISLYFRVNAIANTNKANLAASAQSYQRLVDCTTPNHPCYDEAKANGDQQIKDTLGKISSDLRAQLSAQNATQNALIQKDIQSLLNAIRNNQRVVVFPPTTTTTVPKGKVAPTTTTTTTTTVMTPVAPSTKTTCKGLNILGVVCIG